MSTLRKKLIEVSLPLEAINKASAREKSIRHGHPSTLHLWWARRPLAACRAVLFAQLVDDPSAWPEEFPTEEDQARERARLHKIIAEMVPWEATNNEHILNKARYEIAHSLARGRGEAPPALEDAKSVLAYLAEKAPPVYDPFCGGGSIPLEAQRLGLRAYGSDLNPVAVLVSKGDLRDSAQVRRLPAGQSRARPACGVEGCPRPRPGHPLLRQVDARRGARANRASLPEGHGHRGDGLRARRPQALCRAGADRHRLALGTHRCFAGPDDARGACAAGTFVRTVIKEPKAGLGKAGRRSQRGHVSVRGGEWRGIAA